MLLNLRRSNSGFTLMELLLVTIIFPVIAVAVYGNLRSGAEVMKRLETQSEEEDVAIFFEKVTRDFEEMFEFSGVPFKGDSRSVTFASFLETDPALGGNRGIGEVSYVFDLSKKALLKKERDYHELYKEKPPRSKTLIAHVVGFEFSFFYQDPETKGFMWSDEWEDGQKKLPIGIRLDLELDDGTNHARYAKKIFLPAGG